MSGDPLMELIRSVLDAAGVDVTASTAIEPRIREQFGGVRYYIGRKPVPAEEKKTLVASGYRSGWTTRQIAETWGMPVRTVRWYARRR